MTGKERTLKSLEFKGPDKIPLDIWILPGTYKKYENELKDLKTKYEPDIFTISGPFDHGFNPKYYEVGLFIDEWGSVWENVHGGILGEVKRPVLSNDDAFELFKSPIDQFILEWDIHKKSIESSIRLEHVNGKFVIGGWISLFERMQYLRGTEELYCDIALEEEKLFYLFDITMEFWHAYLDRWLETDVDGIALGDDWGSQISLLINPETWRRLFKPKYQELINRIKSSGKKCFFHSDGYILDIYEDFIEMGVDAINSQIWCMDVYAVAHIISGRITCWGEISRQSTLPYGKPEDIVNSVELMKKLFYKNGGLIGQSEINSDVPLENIESLFVSWNN